MSRHNRSFAAAAAALVLVAWCGSVAARTITLKNQCSQTLWVASSNLPAYNTNGWQLNQGQTTSFEVADNWDSGRIWARTGCALNSAGHLACATGDCPLPASMYSAANNGLYCNNVGGKPPVTGIELTLKGAGNVDFYDLTLVDGYNLPVQIKPTGSYTKVNDPNLGKYNCGSPVVNPMTSTQCPEEMRKTDSAGNFLACWSPCSAFHDPDQVRHYPVINTWNDHLICCECDCGPRCGCGDSGCKYGCSWADNNPAHANMRCFVDQWPKSSMGISYPDVYKSVSPDAYSWQFDDQKSTYQCFGANYEVTFCPTGPTPPPSCDGGLVKKDGIDLYGSDLSHAAASNLDECIAMCKSTSHCSAVTLSAGVCYMKTADAATNQQSCSGCSSAYCIPSPLSCSSMTQLPAIDLYGSDISNAPADSIDACIAQCKAKDTCKAATFANKVCYLKTADALKNQKYCAGCVSAYCAGTDHCPNWVTAASTDLYGGDIAKPAGNSIDSCYSECEANPACVAATLYQNVCYLKSGESLGGLRACDGCTSGKCGGNLSTARAAAAVAHEQLLQVPSAKPEQVFADGGATASPAPAKI